MKWFRLTVRFPPGSEELVWSLLYQFDCIGIQETGSGECEAYFGADADPDRLLQAMGRSDSIDARGQWIPSENWHERWMESYVSFRVGPFFIRPRWKTDPPPSGSFELVLDPQQAFGTGTHATTQLCLELLAELRPAGSMLDVGCGSGILSIAARKLSPTLIVTALDTDWLACQISRQNAAANGVPFPVLCGELAATSASFDLITANLQLDDLLALAGPFHQRLRPAGRLLLSGILVEQAPRIREAYASGFSPAGERSREEWTAFAFQRR